MILINSKQSGGGSLYNLYSTTAIRSQSEDFIIRHEFGHQIVGLADRFYSDYDDIDTLVMPYYCDFRDMINKILDLHTK